MFVANEVQLLGWMMAAVDEREQMRMKFMKMAKQFGWKLPKQAKKSHHQNVNVNQSILNISLSIDSNPEQKQQIVSESNDIAFAENNSFVISTPIPHRNATPINRNQNTQTCHFCNCAISASLIDNHIGHCSLKHDQDLDQIQHEEEESSSNQAINTVNVTNQSNHFLDLCSSEDDDEQNEQESNMSIMLSQKLEFDDSFCIQTPSIDRNRNHNHNHHTGTPLLIREERRRRELQNQIDHEYAMNLQREIEREHQQQQQFVDDELRRQIERERQIIMHQAQREQQVARRNVSELDVSNLSYDALLELFPNEAQGASDEAIRRLPTDIFHKNGCNADADDDKNKCCFCLEQFQNGDEIRRLQCLHIFHKQEIDEWLRRNRVCPICRINVEEHQ